MLLTIHDWIAQNLRNGSIAPLWWVWDRVMRLMELASPNLMATMELRMDMDERFNPERWK